VPAIVEALGSGLPVITTDVPGAGDHIRPGVNGLLQRDPLDAGELAGLLRVGLDPEPRQAWSEAAAASVSDLTWPRLCDRLAALLEALPPRP
jgi:glycosyltransferase involved in cell wall biosynthesis